MRCPTLIAVLTFWYATYASAANTPIIAPPTTILPTAPSATLDLGAVMATMQAPVAGVGAAVTLSGNNLGFAGLVILNSTSTLNARVVATNSTGTVAPPGTYLVRFNATNVGAASTLNLSANNGIPISCALAARPGYTNVQACDMTVTTTGAAFAVTANTLAGVPQLEISSVQVFKVR